MANLFLSPCQNIADFSQEGGPYIPAGEALSCLANVGKTGTGDYGLKMTVTGTSNETGIRVGNIGGIGRSYSFDFKLGTFASLTGSLNLSHAWIGDTASYGTDLVQLGITRQGTRTGAGYYFYLQTPLDSFASLQYSGKVITDGLWHHIELRVSDDSVVLYVDGDAQCYVRSAFKGSNVRAFSLGKWYSTGYSGDLFFDNVSLDTYATPTVSPTYTARNAAAYAGFLQESVRSADGAVVRHMGYPGADGNYGYSYPGSDIVSEGQAYGMIFAVQNGDQANFIKIANFAYTKLARGRNTAEGATATNNATGSPTFPNLMGWKYNDDIGGFYDYMCACDADNDAMAAYFWAHGRWGSSSYTPGVTLELATPNYLQRALDVAHDLKAYTFTAQTVGGTTYQLQSADGISGLNELNPSYLNPVAFKLAKQYDTVNATFWQQAVDGTYLLLTRDAALPTSGAPTEWVKWDTGTQNAVADSSRADWKEFGYNAFRAMYRVYLDYYFYNSTQALTYLTGTFRTFVTNEWNTASPQRLAMQMDGAGTRLYSGYEKTFGTYAKYLTQKVGTPTSVASAILSGKLSPSITFQPGGNGSFWGDNAGDLDPLTAGDTAGQSYYGSSWGIWTYLLESGAMANFGTAGTAVTRTAPFAMDAIINTVALATRTRSFAMDALIKKTLSKAFGMSGVILTSSPTRQKAFSLSAAIAARRVATFGLSAFLLPAPVGTQTSAPVPVASDLSFRDLVSLMQQLSGNQDPEAENAFRMYLGYAQRDIEQELSDYFTLRASTQFQLVPNQDISYQMPADFKAERFVRIVAPVNLSRQIAYVPYERFRAIVRDYLLKVPGIPMNWYWDPSNQKNMQFFRVPDQAYTIQLDYVRRAPDFVSDTDVPFYGHEFAQALAFRALWYYYNSDAVVQPDKARNWGSEYERVKLFAKRAANKRQFEQVRASYGDRFQIW